MDKFREKRWNALRAGLLTAIAVVLVMSAAMGTAWAYFTTYTSARGGVTIHLGHEEEITETFNSWEKTLNISSTEDSRPVYLRARAYCADYDVTYNTNNSDSQNWKRVGDWMYYEKTLAPGTDLKSAGDELRVRIIDVPKSTDPTIEDGDTFNVIVVYESLEAQYDANGYLIEPEDADWDAKVDTTRATLGGED